MDVVGRARTLLERWDRFLRMDRLSGGGPRLRARLNSSIALAFIVLQLINQFLLYVQYGGFSFHHLISAFAIVALAGIAMLPRWTQSPNIFGFVWMTVIYGCVSLATLGTGIGLLGGGLLSSLLPIMVVSPVIIAVSAEWRLSVVAWILATGIILWMYQISLGYVAQADDMLLAAYVPGSELAFKDAFMIGLNQKVSQALIGLTIVLVFGVIFSRMLYMQFEELEDALGRAREAEAAKGDFLAQMSHEIRTPLNGVISMSELLTMQDLPEAAAKQASILNSAGQQLMGIVNDVLDYARLESGHLDILSEPMDLKTALQDVVDLHSAKSRKKGLWLGLDWQPGLPHQLMGDEGRLRQIVNNLVGNAIKFTDDGGVKIGVRGAKVGEKVRLQLFIQDTGRGIPQHMQASIFERYVQSGSGARQGSAGTGLGLSITRQLIELMGGDISVQSVEGRGSVFVVCLDLPVAAKPLDQPLAPERRQPAA